MCENKTDLSRKISVLSFVAMVSVVIIHSRALSGTPASWNVFLQWFITRGLAKWSVPFFFAVSGYWFGKWVDRQAALSDFWRKKWRTLVLPYLLWAIIGTLMCLPLICFNNYVTRRPLFYRTVLGHSTIWECVDNLFGITVHTPEGNAVLWYVRALLAFFVFAPVWRFARIHVPRLAIMAAVLLVVLPEKFIPYLAICTNWWGWILVGFLVDKLPLDSTKRNPILLFMGAGYVFSAAIEAGCQAKLIDCCVWRPVVKQLIPCFGVPFYWALYDYFPTCTKNFPRWFKWTFWIYCSHAIFTSYFMAAVFFVIGKTDIILVAVMLTTPIVGVVSSVISAQLVCKFSPTLFKMLTGGRVG